MDLERNTFRSADLNLVRFKSDFRPKRDLEGNTFGSSALNLVRLRSTLVRFRDLNGPRKEHILVPGPKPVPS